MPLLEAGIYRRGVDVDNEVAEQLTQVFKLLDAEIEELSKAKGLNRAEVRFFRPLHIFALVGDKIIFVVLSVHDLGGIANWRIVDWSDKPMDLESACHLVERDLGFSDVFGFQFPRSVLDFEGNRRREAIVQIGANCIDSEIARLEKQRRIVRLNPIFQGREFLINEKLVFVLSPFEEPFDTIYVDHIKPSVESINGLSCLRADDIYDNRPIIEDIWRCTNEARILIAELTGKNANVFYEIGIAHTIGKEVILITQSMEDVPFDLKHLRCIVYEYTPKGIATLEQNLQNTILRIFEKKRKNRKESNITSNKRGTRGIVGTRHNQETGEVCERSGVYRPECHWDSMQLFMPKGWIFPPCYLNDKGEMDVSSEGTCDNSVLHRTVWHLTKEEEFTVQS